MRSSLSQGSSSPQPKRKRTKTKRADHGASSSSSSSPACSSEADVPPECRLCQRVFFDLHTLKQHQLGKQHCEIQSLYNAHCDSVRQRAAADTASSCSTAGQSAHGQPEPEPQIILSESDFFKRTRAQRVIRELQWAIQWQNDNISEGESSDSACTGPIQLDAPSGPSHHKASNTTTSTSLSANILEMDSQKLVPALSPATLQLVNQFVDDLVLERHVRNWSGPPSRGRKSEKACSAPHGIGSGVSSDSSQSPTSSSVNDAPHRAVILFYKYVRLRDHTAVCAWQKRLCQALELTGKLRIAREGVNGTLAGLCSALAIYRHLGDRQVIPGSADSTSPIFAPFSGIDFKESRSLEARRTFPGLWVRPCTEIIMLGLDPDKLTPEGGGVHLSPKEWHEALLHHQARVPSSTSAAGGTHATAVTKKGKPFIMDCRNWYEAEIGRFVGATPLPMRKFTEFPALARQLVKEECLQDRPVFMYCTGGIRCERASAYLRQELQVREVYQLRGGIHRYIDEFGNGSTSTQCGKDATAVDQGLFVGKNFVFDRRLAISDSHTVDERKPQALESGTALQCSAKVHTNGPGPCSNAASDGSPAAAPPHYTVVGQCSNCAQPWDQYDMQWTCSRCQAVVLLCNGCAAQRRRELSVQRRLPAGHASAATLQPLVCSLCVHLELHPAKVALAASKSQGKGPRALVKSV